MKNIPSQYDLTVGNVEEWRNRNAIANDASRPGYWTPERTKTLFSLRSRGGRPRRRNFDLYQSLCAWSERLFLIAVCAGMLGVIYIIVSVLFALLSGRIEHILDAAKAAN